MQLIDYQKLTSRTNTDLGSKAINAAHVTLGIIGEWEEFLQAESSLQIKSWRGEDTTQTKVDFKLESGDATWYISELANLFNIQLIPEEHCGSEESLGWIAENIKKFLAYNKEIDISELEKRLNSLLSTITMYLADYQITLEECLTANIDKLRLRFPDKFDANLAIQQNDMK